MSRACCVALILGVWFTCVVGQEPAEPQAEPDSPIVYKGTERSAAWVEIEYAKFKDKIASIGGRWVDVGRAFLEPQSVPADVPEPGSELRYKPDGGRVLQILSATDMIVRRAEIPGVRARFTGPPSGSSRLMTGAGIIPGLPAVPEVIFHVTGIQTKDLVDESLWDSSTSDRSKGSPVLTSPPAPAPPISKWLVYRGAYRYVDVSGTKRTIPSYRPHREATKVEFAEALRGGLELVEWVKITKEIRLPRGSKEKFRFEESIVAKPVL